MNRSLLLALTLILSVCVLVSPAWAQAQPKQIAGKVTHVTLYRGQAQVMRELTLDGPAGAMEVIVTDLPAQVIGSSLFAEAGANAGVDIRAVQYRPRAVGEEPRKEIREIDGKLRVLADEVALVTAEIDVIKQNEAHLQSLQAFEVKAVSSDLAGGKLDAEALAKATEFIFTQRREALRERVELTRKLRDLSEEQSLLQRQRGELSRGATHTVHEAVIFLEKRVAGAATVRLGYLVQNCGWSPSYNFRADTDKGTIGIEYNAIIQQMSGEDWTNVKLTLLTASPALSASSAALAPLPVMLGADVARPSGEAVLGVMRDLRNRQMMANVNNRAVTTRGENVRSNWDMNDVANGIQMMEMQVEGEALLVLQRVADVEEGPSLSYELDTPVTLASRSNQQMVRILNASSKAEFYFVATPVLGGYVYREASMSNDTGQDLLAGPVTVYMDGRFVGRSEIGTVARNQSFGIGLGADSRLRTSRELVKREDRQQGGNQVQQFTYRLTVESYKDQAVPVRIYERVPYSPKSGELRVTHSDMSDKLSTDATYLRIEQPKGILRWDVQVQPNAVGEKAHVLTYTYTLEFDRNSALRQAGSVEQQMNEFQELQGQRNKY